MRTTKSPDLHGDFYSLTLLRNVIKTDERGAIEQSVSLGCYGLN